MYSPALNPTLKPVLFRLTQQGKQPMTQVASSLILERLERTELPPVDRDELEIAEEDIPALKEAVRNLPSPNGDLKDTAITLMSREGVPVLAA